MVIVPVWLDTLLAEEDGLVQLVKVHVVDNRITRSNIAVLFFTVFVPSE